MKYLLLLSVFIFSYSCSKREKNDFISGTVETAAQDTLTVRNIKKNCHQNISRNIYQYILCSGWSLNEHQIKNMLSLGKKDESPEISNLLIHDDPSWISADVTIHGKPFTTEIHSMSYYYLTDKNGNRERYTFNDGDREKVKAYFTRILSEDDDEAYEEKLKKAKRKMEIRAADLHEWKGIYIFDNNNYEQLYKKYTLTIEDHKIILFEGNLPGCEIYGIPFLFNNQLYMYYNATQTYCPGYENSFTDHLQDGDLICKIYWHDHKMYMESPVIPYWNDSDADFIQNTPIRLDTK